LKNKKKVLFLIVICVYILFFANVKYINNSVYRSILFCVKSLIPSIFPFMVVSLFVTRTSILYIIENNASSKLLNKLGICKKYFSSIIVGSLSGYITGAKCICEAYEKDGTDSISFSNAVILSNNAGLGFVVSYVGIILWNDIFFGIYVYIAQLLSSILLAFFLFKKTYDEAEIAYFNNCSFTKAISLSITDSARTLFMISSYYVFFSVVTDILSIYIPYPFSSFISLLCEFCKGVTLSKNFASVYLSSFLTGFSIGFGGICVFMQLMNVCEKYPLDKGKYLLFKLMHGFLLGIISMAYFYF